MQTEFDSENETPETEPVQDESQEEEAKGEEETKAEPRRPAFVINVYSWATPIVGVLMLIVGLLGGYFGRPYISPKTEAVNVSTEPQATSSASDTAQRQEMMNFIVGQVKHFKGDPKAPVTLIEFSDYQWPYCGKFATGAGRQIEDNYVKDGKVRFGYWYVAFLGQESTDAAEASECAADQNAFWEYHDLLFERQNGENQGAFAKDKLKQFAADLKLDTNAFNECLDSGKYTQMVKDLTQTANSIGVQSTPTFVVNGRAIIGAQSYEVFQQAIEQALKGTTP